MEDIAPTARVASSPSAKLLAEFLGTAFLVLGVVGSGIMAERLSTDVGLQLLENTLATVGVLVAIIVAFGPISGAHFNPCVTLVERLRGTMTSALAARFVLAQFGGGLLGAVTANVLFDLDPVQVAATDRSAPTLALAEIVAMFGLLVVIFTTATGENRRLVSLSVGAYIGGAYWFTSSTSFANPAVTVARTLSDTFTGIAPSSAAAFVAAQLVGTLLAYLALRILTPNAAG